MKYQPGFTDFFMSPVTGRIVLPMMPDVQQDYIWIGNRNDRPLPSPIIIDLRLEIVDLRRRLSETRFILQAASPDFDSSQALNQLVPGILRHTDGIVSIAVPGTDYLPVSLPYREIWLGNEENIPTPVGRIWDDGIGHGNLPAYEPENYKEIWRMDITGTPVLSSDLSTLEVKVTDNTTDISTLFDDISSILSTINSILDNISSILSSIATITSNITSLFDSVSTINSEITTINDSISSILSTISSIQDSITTINSNISDINVHLGDIDAHLGDIDAHLGDIDAHLGDIDVHLGSLDGSIIDLQGQIDTNVSSGLDHLADLQLQINDGISSGMDHLATINDTLSSLQSQIDSLNTSLSTINSTLTDLQSQIDTINSTITDIQSNITTIQGDITNITSVLLPAVYTYIDDSISNITNNFVAGGIVDMNNNRIINLPCDPVEDNDAVSFCFLWHILHEEVSISWP